MTTREERAAGRRQRRQQGGQAEQSEQPREARQAARDAATRALAAATVTAVRALAAKASEDTPEPAKASDDAPEPNSPEANQVPEVDPEPVERKVRPQGQEQERPQRGADAGRVQDVLRAARDHLRELHGGDAESVSGLERTPNGWAVDLEVVEVRRIPESTDILATYRVELDGRLDLLSYERTARYHRAQADDRGRA